jgi:3-dehydroquinate synthase
MRLTEDIRRIHVLDPHSGKTAYEILVGRALLGQLAGALGQSVKKVMLVYPEALETSAAMVSDELSSSGFEVYSFAVANGEDAKTDRWVSVAWSSLGQAGFSRSDAIIGFGGGATTDLAGFIAATWLRGIKIVMVPTTLLGMVDAAIGGKTGINTIEGKNLVGAFHAPTAVIADLDTLASLPKFELIPGFAEIVKYGFIADPTILDLIEADPSIATDTKSDVFAELIERSIAIKARVTANDFRESGEREFLNYGHTLAHAIEHLEHYKWRHGRAVAVGLAYAAELGRLAGRLSDEVADRHKRILNLLGLDTSYAADRWSMLLTAISLDKKSRGGMLRFVVLDDIAKPVILNAPTPELMHAAFQEIAR